MGTIFLNYTNKTTKTYTQSFSQIDLKKSDRYVALSNLCKYYTRKNIKIVI